MPTRIHALCAATLLAFALPAAPACAEDGVWKVGDGYVVRFEALDLSRAADRQQLLAMVERAAGKMCAGERTRGRERACVSATLDTIRDGIEPGLRASLDVARFERDGILQAQR